MAVITLSEAKTLLQISVNTYDSLITTLIPMIEDEIKEYCNQDFQDSPTLPSWQVWMKLPASQMIGWLINKNNFNGLKSENQGEYSYTKEDSKGGYPVSIMSQFNKVKVANIGSGTKLGYYRDRRGLTEKQLISGVSTDTTDLSVEEV